jgi:hydrogenase-4 membrane subunit HyfE
VSVADSLVVLVLTLAATGFAVLAVESVSLVRSTYWYLGHSCCLVAVYVTYALVSGNRYLFVWAGLAAVNTVILPFLVGGLRYTARRVPAEKTSPRTGLVVLGVVALMVVVAAASLSSLVVAETGSPIAALDQRVSLNLVAAVLLFGYGIIVLLTRRHLFKLALGLLFTTAGAHLTLVQMAPSLFTMVEIEILTKVIGTVFAMLYAVRMLAERFDTTDAGADVSEGADLDVGVGTAADMGAQAGEGG